MRPRLAVGRYSRGILGVGICQESTIGRVIPSARLMYRLLSPDMLRSLSTSPQVRPNGLRTASVVPLPATGSTVAGTVVVAIVQVGCQPRAATSA